MIKRKKAFQHQVAPLTTYQGLYPWIPLGVPLQTPVIIIIIIINDNL